MEATGRAQKNDEDERGKTWKTNVKYSPKDFLSSLAYVRVVIVEAFKLHRRIAASAMPVLILTSLLSHIALGQFQYQQIRSFGVAALSSSSPTANVIEGR